MTLPLLPVRALKPRLSTFPAALALYLLSGQAMGIDKAQAINGLSGEQRLVFALGAALFQRPWVAAPASTRAADGLGPLYNARACDTCHPSAGAGHPGDDFDNPAPALVLRLGRSDTQGRTHPHPNYGEQLQPRALPGHPGEGSLALEWRETQVHLADGEVVHLRAPTARVENIGYGPLGRDAKQSLRLAPSLLGVGLLEAIPQAQLLASADAEDRDGDGISGRPHWLNPADKPQQLGRYGWKASRANLDDQTQLALSRDLGLSSPAQPQHWGDCTQAQTACRAAIHGNSPEPGGVEASAEVFDLLTQFLRYLAPPNPTPGSAADRLPVEEGQALFDTIGCASCHHPEQTAQTAAGPVHIQPYTDLLLHDLGPGLADSLVEGDAAADEWRTAPLWGLGQRTRGTARGDSQSNAGLLHDGRARNPLEAILWHGGEAALARDRVIRLPRDQRVSLLAFLDTL